MRSPVPVAWLGVIMAPPGGLRGPTASSQCKLLPGAKGCCTLRQAEGEAGGAGWGGVGTENSPCPPEKPAFPLALRTRTAGVLMPCVSSRSLRRGSNLSLQLLPSLCPPGGS